MSQVLNIETIIYPDEKDKFNRITSILGLRFEAPSNFYNNLAHVVCTSTIEDHVDTVEKDLHFDPASSAAFRQQLSSVGMYY